MKKLLSLVGTGMLATSAVAPLVANTTYEPKTTDQTTLSYTKQEIKNDELAIPNAGNWDLSTGKGYFGYLWYCICYFYQNDQSHFNCEINLDAFGANTNNANKDGNYFYLGWDDSLQEKWMFDTNNGFVYISKITNKTKDELDHSHDILINKNDEEQNLSTSSFSHQQTVGHSLKLGMKICTTIDIDAYVVGTKISAEISAEGTWTDTVTDTYNATSQKVNVPAHSGIDVDYFFYKTVDQVDTWIYKKYDTSQYLYIALPTNGDYPLNYFNYPAKYFFDLITKYENTDWIFNIQNGYIQKKDGNFYIKSTIPISYENNGTEFVVILGPTQPL